MTNPQLITTPFAENGTKNTIPESGSAEPQLATMQAGFPKITQLPINEGGIPPERADFNGILNLYGQHLVHLNKGLPYEFDQDFANSIGGYPLNARIMLASGYVVQNTQEGNTNNPNLNMGGWKSSAVSKDVTVPAYKTPGDGVNPVTGVADGAYFNVRSDDDDTVAIEYQNVGGSAVATGKSCLSASGVQKLSFFITPEMFGATGQNLEKDQAAFNSMIALGPDQTWQLKPGREYHVTNVAPPANTIIYANWAKLKKSSNDNQNVLNLYNPYNKLYTIEIDGNKSGTTTTGFGIRSTGSFNDIMGFYVHDAGRYGVVFANCENSTIKNGRSNNNGVFATDGSAQADGIYFSNTKYCIAENCVTTGNGRTGLVQTSYAVDPITGEGGIKPELCHKNTFKNCQSSGNAYSDVNTEGVSNPILHNLTLSGGISFSRSTNVDVADISCSLVYATEVTNPTIKRIKIKHAGVRATTDNFYLNGVNLTIDDITIDNSDAPILAGISCQIVDSGTSNINRIKVDRSANGVNISSASIESLANVLVDTASNYKYRLNNITYTSLLPVFESKQKIMTANEEAVTLTGTSGGTIDANTFENGTFYNVDTGGAGSYLNFPANFGDRYLTIETKAQVGVRSYQIARSLFANTVMYRVKSAVSTWTDWGFMVPRRQVFPYSPPNLAAGESITTTVSVQGVNIGDSVNAIFTQFHSDIAIDAVVSGENTVSIRFRNIGTTSVDLASGTIAVKIF